jgi:rhodanese-related sulfurtransferase
LRRRHAPDEYEYEYENDDENEEEATSRWGRGRAGRGRRWLRVALILLVVPLLIGAAITLFAGRPVAFDAIRRITDRKFPEGRWVSVSDLERWRADPARAQPVLLDARTEVEYDVSHLRDAVRIDPYRPSLRPLRGFPKDTAIVLYSSVGYRGARVADFLARQGYTQVYNLDGGQFRWANSGRPVFRQGRPVAEVHPYDPTWGLLLESEYRINAPPVEKRSAAP